LKQLRAGLALHISNDFCQNNPTHCHPEGTLLENDPFQSFIFIRSIFSW
jgi:hypothetical protein